MNGSLRWRLLTGTSLAAILILSLLGLGLYIAMRQALLRDFDASLAIEARLVAGMIEQDDAKITFEFDPQQMPDFLSNSRQRYFQVWRDDGSVLARSPSLGNRDLLPHFPAQAITEIRLPNSHLGRAFVLRFKISQQEQGDNPSHSGPGKVIILIAAQPVEVHRTLELLAWLLTILCCMSVIIMGLVLLRVVGRGLSPLAQLAARIGSFRETDLSERLSTESVPSELTPIVEKLNDFLTRLEQAFTREKSFTADVSHELRTPLAGLLSTLEVCRSRPRDTADYESALDDCRAITDRMQSMVQSLLLLARSDAGQIPIERRSVNLVELVSECWKLFQHRAESRGLSITMELPANCMAATDPDKLQIVLHSLLDNALSYVNEAGHLHILLQQQSAAITIEIANTGSQIAAEDAPRLVERFWRGDTARTDAALHSGLGLSIADRLTKLLGGTITVRTTNGGEFSVRMTLQA